MRIALLLASLLGLIFLSVDAKVPAMPRSARALHHVTRQELTARAQHPDLFNKRDTGDSTPSNTPGPGPCDGFSIPSRRRSEEQVLNAREMASFLMGRGSFTSSNGTTYEDYDYAQKLKRAPLEARSFYHVYNVVKDTLGNKLLEVSIPHYKKWKSTLKQGELVYLSPQTGIRSQDIDELERILLEDPDFVDIQVHGFRITKRFFEVAHSY